MVMQIEASWQHALQAELTQPYFVTLTARIHQTRQTTVVYPPPHLVYNALNLCPLPTVRVVILGQDPYHREGQAHGLAFSVPDGITLPPSLRNIYREIETDIGTQTTSSGNLTRWAKQGVLLLNTTLTVSAGSPASHADWGWGHFTDAVIRIVSDQRSHVVFLLWGTHAQSKEHLIDHTKHLVLTAPHPSPLSAYRGFFGSRHFSQTNAYLASHQLTPILW